MGDISKEDYDRLDLKGFLNYYSVNKMRCITPDCSKNGEEKTINTKLGPFDFILATEYLPTGHITKNLPIMLVCPECICKMETLETEYFKKEEEKKFDVNTPKAKGDRGKNYYKDFSKQSWKADPDAGKNATTISDKDLNNYKKRIGG